MLIIGNLVDNLKRYVKPLIVSLEISLSVGYLVYTTAFVLAGTSTCLFSPENAYEHFAIYTVYVIGGGIQLIVML